MRNNLLYLILILLAPAFPGFSQVNSFSDQYLANLFLLNPAIAGTGQYGTLVVNSRQQWVGWDGAPASQSVTYQTRWTKARDRFNPLGFVNKGKNTYSKVGVGGGFFHDSYGVFHLTGIHLDYSYHLFLSKGRLSLGLSPSFFQIGSTSIVLTDPNDPYLDNPNKSYFIDFNAGAHYFNKNGYAGFSLVQLFNSSVKFGNYGFPGNEDPSLNPDLARSVYAYGGYFFTLNRNMNLKIEPMAVIKLNARNGFRFDFSTTFHLRDMLQAGLSYRWKEGFSVFTGVRLDNLSIRYLFEIPISADVPHQFTSHMIQLSMNIGQPIE
ncbi:MAG: type IX secretion system membrane protein PorP/SprF [Porphyromonadaceae bacterium]|nr:MAG: type IX secretion system membrane protein PorP/SprF [Porphyromonadaceae bacterium]